MSIEASTTSQLASSRVLSAYEAGEKATNRLCSLRKGTCRAHASCTVLHLRTSSRPRAHPHGEALILPCTHVGTSSGHKHIRILQTKYSHNQNKTEHIMYSIIYIYNVHLQKNRLHSAKKHSGHGRKVLLHLVKLAFLSVSSIRFSDLEIEDGQQSPAIRWKMSPGNVAPPRL